jgi:hypothetical protein
MDNKLGKYYKQNKQTIRNRKKLVTRKKRENKYRKYNRTIKYYPLYDFNNKVSSYSSYSPTINKELITLSSIPREQLESCNLKKAYELTEKLKISIPTSNRNKIECIEYNKPEAERYLLKNLKANKHVDPQIIVPPIQSHGNCWFNAMFTTFFVSDKGRKFFHFFRQLMIKGRQKNKSPMPSNLRNAFALLNYGIDCCLLGNEFAYELDTNSIIFELFRQIPENYKDKNPHIVDVDYAGNPLLYYIAIINYLNNNSIQLLFLRGADTLWKEKIAESIVKMSHLPHFIVLEFFEEEAFKFNRKPLSFKINNAKYQIDSAVIRDLKKEHFCSTITCEGQEMGYDGMSSYRLQPFLWKNRLNSDITWRFNGSNHADGTPMEWNFMRSYQLLIYYRVK